MRTLRAVPATVVLTLLPMIVVLALPMESRKGKQHKERGQDGLPFQHHQGGSYGEYGGGSQQTDASQGYFNPSYDHAGDIQPSYTPHGYDPNVAWHSALGGYGNLVNFNPYDGGASQVGTGVGTQDQHEGAVAGVAGLQSYSGYGSDAPNSYGTPPHPHYGGSDLPPLPPTLAFPLPDDTFVGQPVSPHLHSFPFEQGNPLPLHRHLSPYAYSPPAQHQQFLPSPSLPLDEHAMALPGQSGRKKKPARPHRTQAELNKTAQQTLETEPEMEGPLPHATHAEAAAAVQEQAEAWGMAHGAMALTDDQRMYLEKVCMRQGTDKLQAKIGLVYSVKEVERKTREANEVKQQLSMPKPQRRRVEKAARPPDAERQAAIQMQKEQSKQQKWRREWRVLQTRSTPDYSEGDYATLGGASTQPFDLTSYQPHLHIPTADSSPLEQAQHRGHDAGVGQESGGPASMLAPLRTAHDRSRGSEQEGGASSDELREVSTGLGRNVRKGWQEKMGFGSGKGKHRQVR